MPFTPENSRDRAAHRRQVSGQCQQCGKPIIGLTTRMFCGGTCRGRSWRGNAPTGEKSPETATKALDGVTIA